MSPMFYRMDTVAYEWRKCANLLAMDRQWDLSGYLTLSVGTRFELTPIPKNVRRY